MKNVVAYCRVSTSKEDQLNSLAAQKIFFEEFAKKQPDYNLVGIYADEGLSGTKTTNRNEFQRMRSDADKGVFEVILVKDISRFARNTMDFLEVSRHLKEIGVQIIFINYNMSTTETSEMTFTILAMIAQEESSNTSIRIKAAKKANAEKGRVPNLVYGYDKQPKKIFELQINQNEADVVRQIFDWYVNESYGASKIATMLNNKGLRTKRDSSWTQIAITRILRNEIYIGKVINGKQEVKDFLTSKRVDIDEDDWYVIDNPALKIIDPDIYMAAQKLLADREETYNHGKVKQTNRYAFSTLIRCKDCGYSFRRTKRTYANTYVNWVCSYRNQYGSDSCKNATVVAEDYIINYLREYIKDIIDNSDKFIRDIKSKIEAAYKDKQRKQGIMTVPELQAQILALEKKRSRYTEIYTDGLIAKSEYKPKMIGLQNQISQLEEDLRLLQTGTTRADEMTYLINATIKDMQNILSVDEMTNTQLRKIIDRIDVDHDGNVDIQLRLFSEIFV